MGYRTLFTGLGIIAGWLAALLGLSYYFRRRIGPALWRRLHRATVVVYVLGLIHVIGAGTDASTAWLRWFMLLTAVPMAALFVRRVIGRRPGRAPAPAPARRQVAGPRRPAKETA